MPTASSPCVVEFRFYSACLSCILGCFFCGIPAPAVMGVCTPLSAPAPTQGAVGSLAGALAPHVHTWISLQVIAQVSQSSRLPVREADPRGSQSLLPPCPAGNGGRGEAEGSEYAQSTGGAQLPQGCGGCSVCWRGQACTSGPGSLCWTLIPVLGPGAGRVCSGFWGPHPTWWDLGLSFPSFSGRHLKGQR